MAIREIHVIHHTHVDVGYTDNQPHVTRLHLDYLDQVLDYCTETDDYPDDARFRWVSEFSWPVMLYLKERPQRREEMFHRLREGRIELCGLFLDPTELQDRRAFEVALEPAQKLAREADFSLSTVMLTDVPGVGWSLADIMPQQGLSFLSMSPNPMVSLPTEVSRPFWWVGPGGGRVLVWQTDWRWGWYGEGHIMGMPGGYATARERVMEYVGLLEDEGYPWEVLLLHFAADNYPPYRSISDLVREWNDAGDLPRMRLSANHSFFQRMLEVHGNEYPTFRAAWPDWWSEGLGSAAYETGLSRETHARLARIEALQRTVGDDRSLWPIWEDLLLFDEHTWGCSSMSAEPFSFTAKFTWGHKAQTVYRAYDAARRVEDELARTLASQEVNTGPGDEEFIDETVRRTVETIGSVTVHNPLPVPFHGPVHLPVIANTVSFLQNATASEAVQHVAGTALRAAESLAVMTLKPGETQVRQAVVDGTAAHAKKADDKLQAADGMLANEFYLLRHDPVSGRVLSLTDRTRGRELLDTAAPWSFAEVIHEKIAGSRDRRAVWEPDANFRPPRGPNGHRHRDARFVRTGSLGRSKVLESTCGAVMASLTTVSRLPYAPRVETEIRLYRGVRQIDVIVRVDKSIQTKYESLYLALPFALSHPRAFIHSCDAVFEAGVEQLPGSCCDYYAVQDYVALAGDEGWAVTVPHEAPLVQLGDITFGRWADSLNLCTGHLYGWLTNNFWYTNFPAYQFGPLEFCYSLTTGTGALDTAHAGEFAQSARYGVVTSR